MKVVAHHGVAQHLTRKNISKFGNAALNPATFGVQRIFANSYPSRRAKIGARSGRFRRGQC